MRLESFRSSRKRFGQHYRELQDRNLKIAQLPNLVLTVYDGFLANLSLAETVSLRLGCSGKTGDVNENRGPIGPLLIKTLFSIPGCLSDLVEQFIESNR